MHLRGILLPFEELLRKGASESRWSTRGKPARRLRLFPQFISESTFESPRFHSKKLRFSQYQGQMQDVIFIKPQPSGTHRNLAKGRSRSILATGSSGVEAEALHQLVDDAKGESHVDTNEEELVAAKSNFLETMRYHLENSIAANQTVPFYLLTGVCSMAALIFAGLWLVANSTGDAKSADYESLGKDSFNDSLYVSLNVLLAGGFDEMTDINHNAVRIVHFSCLLTGFVLFAILIGFITDTVTSYMEELSAGRSKVCESSHTLILGWNEATARVVVQAAFLRRQYVSPCLSAPPPLLCPYYVHCEPLPFPPSYTD